jgi:hypothetical protein
MTKREALIEIVVSYGVDRKFYEEILAMMESTHPSLALIREMNPAALERLKKRVATWAGDMAEETRTLEGREAFKARLRGTMQRAADKARQN